MKLLKYLIVLIFLALLIFSLGTLIQHRTPDSEILDAKATSCAPVKTSPFGVEVAWHPPYKCEK